MSAKLAIASSMPAVTLGRHVSYWFRNSPRRALHYLSYYKFAARMIGAHKRVLDLGCGEGLGTWILAAECGFARGVDLDENAIAIAQSNWTGERAEFLCQDALELVPEPWDAVTNFDFVEHILPSHMDEYWSGLTNNLAPEGIAIIGTPNLTSQQYASPVSKLGHVNVYSGERLEEELSRYFTHVFLFAANDEVVHTGFSPMAHYLIAVGVKKRTNP